MTSKGTAHGRFQGAIQRRHLYAAEMAARELGHLNLADALALTVLIRDEAPDRYERAALRWLQRFADEHAPSLEEVGLAAVALGEMRNGRGDAGAETLRRLLRC